MKLQGASETIGDVRLSPSMAWTAVRNNQLYVAIEVPRLEQVRSPKTIDLQHFSMPPSLMIRGTEIEGEPTVTTDLVDEKMLPVMETIHVELSPGRIRRFQIGDPSLGSAPSSEVDGSKLK